MGRVTSGPNPLAGHSRVFLIFFAFVAILSVTGAAMAANPDQGSGRTVIAEFQNVGPITSQAVVRIGGTDVGTTGTPTIDADRHIAILPLNLQAKAFPLYKNATAQIGQLSLIGEKYVNLSPGTPDAGVMEPGDRLTTQHTTLNEDYQNIVQTLNDPTAAGLSSLVRTFGEGIQGRGQNVQQILQRLAPAFNNTSDLLASVNRQNGILGQIVDQVQPLVNGLAADKGRTLDGTLNSATSLLNTTAVNEQNLQATLQQLPSTLAAAQHTLGTLTGTARAGEETLGELRPTTDNLTNISHELQGFDDSARPALKALNPLLDDANRLLDEAQPLAAELRRTGPPLYDTFHNLRPIGESAIRNLGGPYGTGADPKCYVKPVGAGPDLDATSLQKACTDPRVEGILGFLHNFALLTNGADAAGHYARLFTIVDANHELPVGFQNLTTNPCAFQGPGSQFFCINGKPRPDGVDPSKFPQSNQQSLQGPPPGHGGGGDWKASLAAQDNALGKAMPGLNNTILKGDPQASGSATGMNPTQEQNALATLMGGR